MDEVNLVKRINEFVDYYETNFNKGNKFGNIDG